jgi:predicted metalloprotease
VVDKKLKTEGRRRQGWALSGGAAALAFIAVLVWQPWRPGALVPNANNTQTPGTGASTCEAHPQACDFARAVLASTEDVWAAQFQQGRLPDYGERPGAYQDPTLVVFSGTIATGCGSANSDAGPFYCPADLRLYVDPNFYEIVATRLNAPGDFVQAYMIAHEVGHHVQNLIGATLRQAPGETANQTSVRVELQADCLAGVWSHTASAALLLDDADLREALDAAHNTLGESHEQPRGSSAQRTRWFRRGFGTGDARQCDSFALPYAQL